MSEVLRTSLEMSIYIFVMMLSIGLSFSVLFAIGYGIVQLVNGRC